MVAVTGVQKTIVGLAIALVVAMGGAVGLAVWRSEQPVRTYPSVVRDGFLVSCAEGGKASDSECGCFLRHIEDRMQLTEYTRYERAYFTTGQIDPALQDAIAPCGGSFEPKAPADPSATVPVDTATSVDHSQLTVPSGD